MPFGTRRRYAEWGIYYLHQAFAHTDARSPPQVDGKCLVSHPRAPAASAQMVPWFPSGPNSPCPPRRGHPRGPGLTRGPPCRPPTCPPSRAPLPHAPVPGSHVAPRPVTRRGPWSRAQVTSRGLPRGGPYRAHPLNTRAGVTRAPVPGSCMLPRPGLQWAAAPLSPVSPRHTLPRTHPPSLLRAGLPRGFPVLPRP